jgi:hypothetical protein
LLGKLSSIIQLQFRPTRLIYVSGPDSSTLQLLETKFGIKSKWHRPQESVEYTVLSHCWGSPTAEEKKRFCTTRENYHDRLNGFSIHDLPKTFQDAVQVTRALKKKFIWIDALCIIQTVHGAEDADWKFEAGRMEKTFGSAYCTIAADSAVNWEQGFLQRRSPPYFKEVPGQRRYACDTKHDFENDVNSSRLNERAWVLQERVLSRRILHFTENHTYFACGDSVRCENFMELKRCGLIVNIVQ